MSARPNRVSRGALLRLAPRLEGGVLLKVIAGDFGGRVLKTARGRLTRPLRAPVREALFNVLGDAVVDAEVWDLFAGTGGSGIEALSRGARRVSFLEKSNQALVVLRDNLEQLALDDGDRARVFKADAWLADVPELVEPPDLILFDPPYAAVAEDPSLAVHRATALAERMTDDGLLCFHFEEGLLDVDDFDEDLDVDLRRWGRTAMAILRRPVAGS